MSKSAKATKLALTLPRDAKGKFLPRGSKNLFKKKVKKHGSSHVNGRKRKRKTKHGSHQSAGSILELLDPIRDVISLLSPLLGGSHTKAHKKRQDNFQTLITGNSLAVRKKPMAKRRRNNNNGTRVDIFPNFLTGTLSQVVADTFITVLVPTPIPRIQTTRGGNKATVMELLWWEILLPSIELSGMLGNITTFLSIGTPPTGVLPFNNPRVVAEVRVDAHINTSGAFVTMQPFRYEMQSMDGHGYLMAAESFHVSIFSANTAVINPVEWRLYYRFIDIPLSEFIGLVQSTQQ